MRIAEIVCTFPPYKGGMGKVAYDNSRTLFGRGKDVTVFTPFYNFKSSNLDNGVSIKRLFPIIKYGNAAFLPQLIWRLKNFDVVHLHYPFFGAAEIVLLLRKVFKKKFKLIVTYHMDTIASGWLGVIFRFYNKYFTPIILREADNIIVSSFDYADNSNIKNFKKINSEKFIELPFGVDIKKFCPRKKPLDLIEKYKISSDEKVFLFVGGLDKAHYFKGVNNLIKGFYNFKKSFDKKCRLIIVGDGDLRFDYEQTAFNFGLRDSVIFAGRVSDEDLPRFYNLADLFILPSINSGEAFGIVLLEASSSGIPVIASNLVGVRSVVSDGENGFLIDPGSIDDLVDKMKLVLSSDELREKLGIVGRKIVEKKYDINILEDKLVRIFL